MPFSKTVALVATAMLAVSSNAHMMMRTPVPYGKSTLNNSPLDPSGSDFPCKQRPGVYNAEGAQNVMQIGVPQTLSFTGSAVHGGGSCQVALTTDLQPTKDSKWMVIKSIEGGCPASVPGNLPADPNGSGASTFQFTVPEGIAPGEYTLSWSWLNKIGNREYYQNCAPATVVGKTIRRYALPDLLSRYAGSKNVDLNKRQSNFPDLYVANLASINSLTTQEGYDYTYPDPGQDVVKAGSGPYMVLAGGSGGSPQQPGAPAPQPTGAPVQQPTEAPAPPNGAPATPPTQQPTGPPNGSPQPTGPAQGYPPQQTGNPNGLPVSPYGAPPAVSPGNFAEGASSQGMGVQVTPVTLSTDAIPAPTGSTSDNGTKGSTGPAAAVGACQEGDWFCSADGTSFRRCASASWSVPIPMAAGTKCEPGVSSTFVETRAKRHLSRHLRLGSF